ncbi:hypothetical protein ANO11243_013840 [Dothideomycetidae sp. 11243]|nr:hypothetical protein ANO11243_013840 [fungal sp. No.11243]
MDAQTQVESAIEVAFSPTADPNLKSQAYTFLEQLRSDASGWQVCLALFVRSPPPSEVVRHVSLEVVNNAVQSQKVDQQGLEYAKDGLKDYIQRRYTSSSNQADVPALQNKLTQTLTYLFASLYGSTWTSFFDDFRSVAGNSENLGLANPAGTLLYLRILRSVHDEIADVLIPRTQEEQKRNNDLKDLIRRGDAAKITNSWREILSRWRQIDLEIVDLCLRCVSRWVSWTDISLIVNPDMLQCLWDVAGQEVPPNASNTDQGKVRVSAIFTLTEIVAKKMPPADKIELLRFLNLTNVLAQLVATPALSDYRSTSKYDTDLAETVAKLVNTAAFDIIKVLDNESIDNGIRSDAEELFQLCMPFLLRFFSDEYDEICSTVIPSISDLLTMFRKRAKAGNGLPAQHAQMLQPILDNIIVKMKYDETAEWGAEDEGTDEAEFQDLRKRLHVLEQTIAGVNEGLFMQTISQLVANTFNSIDVGHNNVSWREVDLALYEMFLFGELAVKNGGLYHKGVPTSTAAQHLVEMMSKLVTSNLSAHPHPAIQLQYLEICVRYYHFFEHNPGMIPRALENFVRFIHSDHAKVRTRSWYLFYRFIKQLRTHLGADATTVMQSIGDLLHIKAELPTEKDDDDSSDVNDSDAVFTSQLYLFEAIGCVASTTHIPLQDQTFYARSVLDPLISDLNSAVPAAGGGDEQAVLQVHHVIMAIGTVAKGFCDWMPGVSSAGPPPASELSAQFHPASEAILAALESLRSSIHIRTAARFSFSRMLGVSGARILEQLPRWIDGLLPQTSTRDEMATFLRLLDQVVFGFKTEISSILDSLLTPLLQRVFTGFSEPTTGTDDMLQLTELKSQYLNFILVILNNDLASVIVSPTNQGNFESLLSTLEHFCRDANDYATARLSFSVLTRMTSIWGGPDLPIAVNGADANLTPTPTPTPALPGFDSFAMTRFSPLTWTLISSPSFNPKDAQARTALGEAATLQWTILRKCGAQYESYLAEQELPSMGFGSDVIGQYVQKLKSADSREWKKFWTGFVTRARGG